MRFIILNENQTVHLVLFSAQLFITIISISLVFLNPIVGIIAFIFGYLAVVLPAVMFLKEVTK